MSKIAFTEVWNFIVSHVYLTAHTSERKIY